MSKTVSARRRAGKIRVDPSGPCACGNVGGIAGAGGGTVVVPSGELNPPGKGPTAPYSLFYRNRPNAFDVPIRVSLPEFFRQVPQDHVAEQLRIQMLTLRIRLRVFSEGKKLCKLF